MKIICAKNDFRCVVLEHNCEMDLQIFYQAQYMRYSDDNPDVSHIKGEVLEAMKQEGVEYWRSLFNYPDDAHFVLFKGDDIIGSASFSRTSVISDLFFNASHVHSSMRGQKLVDLLYQAREKVAEEQTDCTLLTLWTVPNNSTSQKAAKRNGFYEVGQQGDRVIFEKELAR